MSTIQYFNILTYLQYSIIFFEDVRITANTQKKKDKSVKQMFKKNQFDCV